MFFIFAGCGGVMMAFFGNTASEVLARLFLAALAFIAAGVAYAVSNRRERGRRSTFMDEPKRQQERATSPGFVKRLGIPGVIGGGLGG